MTIRVAIIEDHDDYRDGLAHLINHTEGFQCVGRYVSVEEATRNIPEADVVLLDIGLPGKSGIEGIAELKRRLPDAQVIMLTVFEDDRNIFEAIRAGANGYLLKKTPPAKLLLAIEEAASGGMPMTPFVARQVVDMFKQYIPPEKENFSLTARESEVLALLVDGLNYAMIAEKLFISLDTVRNHIRHIYEKLHVHSKAEAVAKAMRSGLTGR
ncbi:MAG TPA: response regulator transcription factor [Bacteroidota bacterium]|nr:response regulator transcription factor [Bacteroidota bacterium]